MTSDAGNAHTLQTVGPLPPVSHVLVRVATCRASLMPQHSHGREWDRLLLLDAFKRPTTWSGQICTARVVSRSEQIENDKM